ncbi:hypothetical protein HK100_005492 [Physocladia obscura]|uniref:Uncharacterized protein n=1 Tax=Physocladia obscura TaxID=109957 RepID=A0AAD5T8F7_9FUNG|nr:hypothetical protein HK100_005492 [Physocladia obscura]
MSGMELTCDNWGVDRVINGIVIGVSGEYRNEHCVITHQRVNDMKEAAGRKVFATVETLTLEMERRGINQVDFRIVTQLIIRDYLDNIRRFRNSQAFQDSMDKLKAKKNGH